MEVIGYKCFHEDLTNQYGMPFQVGKIYVASGAIQFGVHGNGFHLCKNMEDTLRYFDAMNQHVQICEVQGSGEIISYYDDYNEYYDMFAVSNLKVLKLLSREEIIEIGLSLGWGRVERFLSQFRLTAEEIKKFRFIYQRYSHILKLISYYQEGDKDAFVKKRGVYHG